MKKTSFLSKLSSKMALAAVALASALFVGCSEEDIVIDNPTTPTTPELANPTCQITVNVIDAGTGAVVTPSLTASAGTVSGNTVVLTGESISAQTVTITQAKGENYVEDGIVSVAIPALSKGQAAYLSATIIMVPKSNVNPGQQGVKYQVRVIVLDQNGKEVTTGLDKITVSGNDNAEVKDGVVILTDDEEIAAQNLTVTYPANDKYNEGKATVKVPAITSGEVYDWVIIYVTEKGAETPKSFEYTFANGYVATLPTAAGIDELPVLDEFTAIKSTPQDPVVATTDGPVNIPYTHIWGMRPEEPLNARSVEDDILTEAKAIEEYNSYKEEERFYTVDLKKGQTATLIVTVKKEYKLIEFVATKGEDSVKLQFYIAIYSTSVKCDITGNVEETDDYEIIDYKRVSGEPEEPQYSEASYEAGEFQVNWPVTYYVQSGEKVISSRATKSELIAQKEVALNTYTEVEEKFTQFIPHYYVATATSTVTKTPITYTFIISNGVKEDTFTISTVNYSSSFTMSVVAGEKHSHAHCDGHNGHGHGDTENAGGGIVNPVN